jgi:hypothetical protein
MNHIGGRGYALGAIVAAGRNHRCKVTKFGLWRDMGPEDV